MVPKVLRVKAMPGYKLQVSFKGSKARIFDVKPYLNRGIFKELKDVKYFKKVRVVWGGVEWPHEQDLSADTLFSLGVLSRSS